MANTLAKDPKDDKITNKDDSITNKDGDNDLEKGKQPSGQNKTYKERAPAVTLDNEDGDPGPPAKENKEPKDEDEERERLRHVM